MKKIIELSPPSTPVKKSKEMPSKKPLQKVKKIIKEKPSPKLSVKKDSSKPPPRKIPRKKDHFGILSSIGKIVEKNRQFLNDRRGGAVAQSTAVLIPYVLSLL